MAPGEGARPIPEAATIVLLINAQFHAGRLQRRCMISARRLRVAAGDPRVELARAEVHAPQRGRVFADVYGRPSV